MCWDLVYAILLHENAQTLEYEEKLPLCASKCQIILESGILIKSKCVTQMYCLLQFSLKYLWWLFCFVLF